MRRSERDRCRAREGQGWKGGRYIERRRERAGEGIESLNRRDKSSQEARRVTGVANIYVNDKPHICLVLSRNVMTCK